ncbi:large multi-functional protein [Cellvibrio zantedeschiae]|uniref:Large multi-functional protein n=1 Tax=Cellvibrio zantedeschiae TaxID=1237077 RepID=A0ABQ3AUG3_9GAMM|nr:hypothetical protein [Cellvibrio zantedeschiae]GGY67592.1 large multi-functional protein [Cellvibrio zantedeschiae]
MKKLLILFYLLFCASTHAAAQWSDYYDVENIPLPDSLDPQIGGLTTLNNGKLVATFHSGEVMIYDPANTRWSTFASGLHEPLGVVQGNDENLYVMQWGELTRLVDNDKNGVAEKYQTVFDDFGVSGNYHEFAFGPAKDSAGNLYISLNVASYYNGVFREVRGDFSPIGFLTQQTMSNWKQENWEVLRNKAGRMYSRVPYRGWVFKIDTKGKATPFASGFRSPDGIGIDEQDQLWVTDNQGDWRGTSPLYHVKQNGFYGHPASLVWRKGWTRNPLEVPVAELNKMQTPASALFPQGELANSPTQPVTTLYPELFGLPKGELLIGEMNQPTLIRFLPEKVNGFVQGALIPFLNKSALGIGNHRLTFGNDGSLYVGKIHLTWAGGEGVTRVTWNKKPFLFAQKVSLQPNGFKILFNQAIGETMPKVSVTRHTYNYHADYGSEKIDLTNVPIISADFNKKRTELFIRLPEIKASYLYTITLDGVADHEGNPLMGDVIRYNVVKKVL